METKRLVPYSVYLDEWIVKELKKKAKSRQASSLIRDAVTATLRGHDIYSSGYNSGLQAAMDLVAENILANKISFEGKTVSKHLIEQLKELGK